MKYDKDTMNSLQEAYASVNEVKYYSGKDRNKKTGTPKKLQNQTSKTSNKKPKGSMPTGGDGTAYMGEEKVSKNHPNHPDNHEDHPDMSYKDAAKIRVEKKTAKKQVESGNRSRLTDKYYPEKKGLKYPVGNKIVPMKTRTEEAIKMTKKEYAKTHKDFKSDDKKNPRVTRYVPGKGTVSTPVELTDEVNKENCGCGQTPCKTYGNMNEKKKEMDDKMKEVEDMRSLPTRMNLIKTKLRAMGLNMSHQLKGKELSEVIDYTLSELNRYEIETGKSSGSVNMPKGTPTQKGGDTNPVTRKVRTSSRKETGRPEGQRKTRGKGEITPDMIGPSPKLQKKIDNVRSKRALDAEARKAGYKNTQDYVDVQAVRKGGLGT